MITELLDNEMTRTDVKQKITRELYRSNTEYETEIGKGPEKHNMIEKITT